MKGFSSVAKSKTTKRPARPQKKTEPESEVKVCRRRGDRRQAQSIKPGSDEQAADLGATQGAAPQAD